MFLGTPLYEWLSHNLFASALLLGSIGVVLYFVVRKRKGWYR